MPVHNEESAWDAEMQTYNFYHTEEDHALGIRGYFCDVLEGLQGCHLDVQFAAAGTENCWASYTNTYVSKMSDQWSDDLLNDDNGMSGDATAAAVLARYQPLEPEM
eukprot:11451829-Karenia_brevis.AAC.1